MQLLILPTRMYHTNDSVLFSLVIFLLMMSLSAKPYDLIADGRVLGLVMDIGKVSSEALCATKCMTKSSYFVYGSGTNCDDHGTRKLCSCYCEVGKSKQDWKYKNDYSLYKFKGNIYSLYFFYFR